MSADIDRLIAAVERVDAAREAVKRGDAVMPIEAGHVLRNRRGPGSYEKAVRRQREMRLVSEVLKAAGRPPVPGEQPIVAQCRAILTGDAGRGARSVREILAAAGVVPLGTPPA